MKKTTLSLIMLLLLVATGCISQPAGMSDTQFEHYEETIKTSKETLKDKNITKGARIEALTESGFAYETLGKENKAIKLYKEVLELEPTHFVALNNLTVIYENRGDIENARYYVGELYTYHGLGDAAILKDTIRILCKNNEFDRAKNVLAEFAIAVENDGKYIQFISDQFEYIGRMSTAAEAKQAE